MTIYSKINIIYRLQKWMDSVPGQTFLNYAYSWGASIVILGTLFKLTHRYLGYTFQVDSLARSEFLPFPGNGYRSSGVLYLSI